MACILCDIPNVTHFFVLLLYMRVQPLLSFFAWPKKPFTDGWSAWYDT